MLDPDISTTAALQHLHQAEDDVWAVDRRRFLQLVGMGLGAGLVAGPGTSLLDSALGGGADAWAAGPIGPADGILVVIGMFGGNDGLNTVVPFNDGRYYDQHGALAIPAGGTIQIDGNTGLHPALTEFKRFWDADQLAIVEGIGYPNPDLSHFNSMAKWMAGRPTGIPTSGWLGRWLDQYLSGSKDLYAAAEVGNSLPLHLIGQAARGTTVPAGQPAFGVPREWRVATDQLMFQAIRNLNSAPPATWLGAVGQAQADQLDVAQTIGPVIPSELPDTNIVARLEIAARLINANLGFRVLTAGWGDFDSHAGQPSQHPVRMQELNEALQRFFALLHPDWGSRVTVMTFSEFGRTSWDNDGAGTDHGTSAPHFVLGSNVKGGFYGQRPSLAGLERWDRMPFHVDFRDYYGSIIDGWLTGDASSILGKSIDDLGLFDEGPNGSPSFPGTVLAQYVPMNPVRLVDTRSGRGAPKRKVGAETMKVQIAGQHGIPADGLQAVALNITSIKPDTGTFLTAYPSGDSMPETSTVNPIVGANLPNMTVVGVGRDGAVNIANAAGHLHVAVDIMGYFKKGPASQVAPLTPSRVLDTRNGTGAPRARVRGGQTLKLKIAGRGGVPGSGVDAVVFNLTVVRPSTGGFVTAWPSQSPMAEVSNINHRPGVNVPNLVMCKLGPDGSVNLQCSAGEMDLLADVVGFYASSGSKLVKLSPARLLDTRVGTGAAQARVGAKKEVVLQVSGRGGVPTQATAVMLNVTAVRPSAKTYVTAYPTAEARPTASNLNVEANEVIPNLVLAKLGSGGRVTLYNDAGNVHLLADVTAYFV